MPRPRLVERLNEGLRGQSGGFDRELTLLSALQTVHPALGESALATLESPQPPSIESLLTTLINEIAAVPDRLALVLDDYHVIKSQPIHDGLAYPFEHMPPQLHLLIASRTDPPLPLHLLRARQQLTELRAAVVNPDNVRLTPL